MEKTGEGMYRFVENAACDYPADYEIIGGFAHMSPEEALGKTINTLKRKERLSRRNIVP